MIERYSRKIASGLWNDDFRYTTWLKIELLVCEAQAELGNIPQESLKIIKEKAAFDISRINEIEKNVKHDMIAFLTNVAEYVGPDSRYIHMGLTSSDILDTCFSIQLKKSAELILEDITKLLEALKEKAFQTKYTICIGRSHGIHAEPTTLGLKFARFYQEFKRNYSRIKNAIEEISICKISGAVGQFANIDPFVEEYVAKKLGLQPEVISSQVIPRDRHAVLFARIAIVASSIENVATEIRNSQRTEIMEMAEHFDENQKGSSSMPHKKNPILSENLTGLARIIRGAAIPALENIALWHERDISHSSVERFIGPTSCITLDFALYRLTSIIKNLDIFEKNISHNLNLSNGLIFSQKVLLKLINHGFTREDAYEIVQENAFRAYNNKTNFLENLQKDNRISKYNKSIESVFNYDNYTKNVDYIFDKVFRNDS